MMRTSLLREAKRCRRCLAPLLMLSLALAGCATQAISRPLRTGDVIQLDARQPDGPTELRGTVTEAAPGRVVVRLAGGDSLVLASDSTWQVRLREGLRGAGIIGKSLGIGLLVGAAPGLLVAPFESDSRPANCSFFCWSDRDGALIGAVFGGFAGGTIGLVTGAVLATMPHWYVVPHPVPPRP